MIIFKRILAPVLAFIIACSMLISSAVISNGKLKITYWSDADDLRPYEIQYYEEGEISKAPKDPTKSDYDFVAWYEDKDLSGSSFVFGLAVTEDITLYAKWKAKSEDGSGEGDGDDEDKTETVLTSDTAISLVAGQTWRLIASEGTEWKSSDTSVATVNGAGEVTAKAKGVSKVTATTSGEVITCTVIVLAAYEGSSSGSAKDPFSFSQSIDIGSIEGAGSGPVVTDPNADEYTVTFSDGAIAQNVAKNGLVVEPLVENDGHYLKGWYANSDRSAYYDFSQPVTAPLHLTADWGDNPSGFELIKGNEESIALEWSGAANKVEYKLHNENSWTTVDTELVRASGGYVRADILGLKAGTYDVKVNDNINITEIPVKAYDRSGYAHFNYNQGVGAYNNDGTLKENALVIYVTDENKDTVMEQVAEKENDVTMFNIPHYTGDKADTTAKDWSGHEAKGIGWWLNNNQYTSSNAGSSKNKNPSNTYDPVNGGNLGFKMVKRPIVIRFIGTVTTPEGCTAFNSIGEGGGVGDNGHMARMKNLANVTLEGVGDDAVIQGWGFHYVAGSDKKNDEGTSFEVRNLTFREYPEDAVGMEGQATSKAITAPVERCWIHHNTFLPGRCENPAESDKKEGDGSCDFKRGYYFTASYNYFEYCHKTNLIGSADDSLQYNMTYHHNIWYQCGSRIPLTRQANVHFYNNYVFGDPTEKTTPYSWVSVDLSYVHSLRASCYLFSEYNYYDGCKNILRGSEGGDGKFFGNTYYACSNAKVPVTEVSSRTQAVSNSCKDPTGSGTDYSTFDTSSTLFYYDSTNKKTNVSVLDDSISARLRTIFYSGAQGHGEVMKKKQQMNTSAPVTDPSITKDTKGKGQVYVFSVAAKAELTIEATAGKDASPQVIRNDGKVYLDTFSGKRTVWLDAGTYMVCASIKDKEIVINSLSVQVDSEQAAAARIANAERSIANIPDTITRSSGAVISQAEADYNALKAEERGELSAGLAERLAKAQTAYEDILVAYAIARIDYIGTVTLDSKNDIEAATSAYNALSASAKAKVTNHDKLVAATAEFAEFAIDSVKFEIERLPLYTSLEILLDSKPAVELALELYNAAYLAYGELDKDDRDDVDITNIEKSLEILNGAMNLLEFKEALKYFENGHEVTPDDSEEVTALRLAYGKLTESQISALDEADAKLYKDVTEAYAELTQSDVETSFVEGKVPDDYKEVFSFTGSGKNGTVKVDGETYGKGLKLDGSGTFKVTVTGKATLTLYLLTASPLKLDGVVMDKAPTKSTAANDDCYILEIVFETAGTYTFTKGNNGENDIFYAKLKYDKTAKTAVDNGLAVEVEHAGAELNGKNY